MNLQQASRKKAKIKMGLQGPSGSGKTKDALLIAYGLCGSWEHVAVIDTENNSADLYADLGPYKTLSLVPPFTPERYVEAVNVCLSNGMQVVVIDSSSHEWDNLLEYHGSMQGNSFTNWAKVTPRHDAFVTAILQAPVHVICTIRSKQEYVLSEKNGKQVPEKVGMKGIQRDNLEYEFTILLELDMSLKAKASKDRTGLFFGKPEFIPTIESGKAIADWCSQGVDVPLPSKETIASQIEAATNVDQLLLLFNTYPQFQESLLPEFTKRRQQLLNNFSHNINHQANGIS